MSAGPASADDSNCLVVTLRPHNENEAPYDRADCNEPIFGIGVGLIEDFQIIRGRREEIRSLLEGDAVVSLVREILGLIPRNPHTDIVGSLFRLSQWLTHGSHPLLFHAAAKAVRQAFWGRTPPSLRSSGMRQRSFGRRSDGKIPDWLFFGGVAVAASTEETGRSLSAHGNPDQGNSTGMPLRVSCPSNPVGSKVDLPTSSGETTELSSLSTRQNHQRRMLLSSRWHPL